MKLLFSEFEAAVDRAAEQAKAAAERSKLAGQANGEAGGGTGPRPARTDAAASPPGEP